MPPDYGFPRLTRTDYPLIRDWLSRPHIGGWWGAPEEEITLIEEDIDRNGAPGATDMRLVTWEGTPFAYVQDYALCSYPQPQFAAFPDNARAMDTFIGAPAFLGRGHAAAYLRQRALALKAAGAPTVVIDPDPANARAIAAYRRAGFQDRGVTPAEDGESLVLVMEFAPAPLA